VREPGKRTDVQLLGASLETERVIPEFPDGSADLTGVVLDYRPI
jgi:hypothetical protein